MQVELEAWQQRLEFSIPANFPIRVEPLNLLEQLENLDLKLDETQLDPLRHELELLLAYLVLLMCICPITSEFVYP